MEPARRGSPQGQAGEAAKRLDAGQVVAGRFEVRRLIGVGRAGAVYAALDRESGTEVAVKIVRADLVAHRLVEQRLCDEVASLAKLDHPHIVSPIGIHHDGDIVAITMPLRKGTTLRARLDDHAGAGTRASVADVVRIGAALCDGLAHAHTCHGLLAPENVLADDDGAVAVTGFGTRGLLRGVAGGSPMVPGQSIPYIAPEQVVASAEPDVRADQYAVAAILYEMLTGRPPAGRVRSAKHVRPDTPVWVSDALDRALEADPDARFADMATFGASLRGRRSARVRRWVAIIVFLMVVGGGLMTSPTWRPYAASWLHRVTQPATSSVTAERAQALAQAAAGSWDRIADALPEDQIPAEIEQAKRVMAEGDERFDAGAFDDAASAYRESRKLYEFHVAAAMRWFREAPALVAATAAELTTKLGDLERTLYARVAEAERLAATRKERLAALRDGQRRSIADQRWRQAADESALLRRLQTLTGLHVFGESARDEVSAQVRAGDLALEAGRYEEALRDYAQARRQLESLLARPAQFEALLRQKALIDGEISRFQNALGPTASKLPELTALIERAVKAVSDVDHSMEAGQDEATTSQLAEAADLITTMKSQAAEELLARAHAALHDGQRTEAIRALNEMAALVPDHDEQDTLRREILDHRVVNSVGMELAIVPPGRFVMGSPADEAGREKDETQREARVDSGLLMSTTEVTQAQWHAVMGDNPSVLVGDNRPVDHVSWTQAVAFCEKLSEREGRTYRLPTELEWEYACRAGTRTPFAFGDMLSTHQANYDGTFTPGADDVEERYRAATTPVGRFAPNAWGMHDMHGNVWEWCSDEGPATTGAGGFSTGSLGLAGQAKGARRGHVLRGGSWRSRATACRSANRVVGTLEDTPGIIGFRVVLEAE